MEEGLHVEATSLTAFVPIIPISHRSAQCGKYSKKGEEHRVNCQLELERIKREWESQNIYPRLHGSVDVHLRFFFSKSMKRHRIIYNYVDEVVDLLCHTMIDSKQCVSTTSVSCTNDAEVDGFRFTIHHSFLEPSDYGQYFYKKKIKHDIKKLELLVQLNEHPQSTIEGGSCYSGESDNEIDSNFQ